MTSYTILISLKLKSGAKYYQSVLHADNEVNLKEVVNKTQIWAKHKSFRYFILHEEEFGTKKYQHKRTTKL